MKRLIVPAACLVIAAAALVGCSKKASESPAPPAAATPPAAPAGGPSAAAQPAEPAEAKKIEITEDLVKKYMDYQKESFAIVQEYVAQTRKNMDSAKGDTMKTLKQISINSQLTQELEEKQKAKRQAMGLGEEEFRMMQDAAQTVAVGRALYTQMGGDAQMAKMQAEQKAAVAKLPAEQRAAAEAQMADISKSLLDVKNGTEVRKKYGDQAADILLKHADELATLYSEGLKMLGGK